MFKGTNLFSSNQTASLPHRDTSLVVTDPSSSRITIKKPFLSPTPTLEVWSESFQMQSAALQLCWPGRPRGLEEGHGGAGLDRAGLLGCWSTGRPRRGLAGWASSMERLIPAGTKSLPVVLLEQQQQERSSEWLQLRLLYNYNHSRTTTVLTVLLSI